jgi:hypothetical protein
MATEDLPPPMFHRGSLSTPSTNFFASLVTATGKWEKETLGTLDPGQKQIWGVQWRVPDSRIRPAYFTGHAVILRKKQ